MKKIVLIGDSIREGYCEYVKMAFADKAKVMFPDMNCRFSTYVLRELAPWRDYFEWGSDVDAVHWNAGLWDCLRMLDGQPLVPLDEYKRNVERICNVIKMLFPEAKMIFATSTPVQEEGYTGMYKRFNADIEAYNQAAAQIVMAHGGQINDLYACMLDTPPEYHSDMTHYNTKEGTRQIANQVIRVLEQALELQATPLDYDALFAAREKIVGM